MLLIDAPPLPPAQSVALDDFLLDLAAAGRLGGEALRLWTADRVCVVMGHSGKPEAECHADLCRRDGVPVVQRPSGGGTVLLGPGCLNYTLILDTRRDPRLGDVKESYRIILGRIVRGLNNALEQGRRAEGSVSWHGHPARDSGCEVAGAFTESRAGCPCHDDDATAPGAAVRIECCSDLAAGDRKFSGTAQLRRRGWLLHHGTLLCGCDLALIERYLKHPPREPAWRQGRPHGAFITNLPLAAAAAAAAIRGQYAPFTGTWSPQAEDLERLQARTQPMCNFE